MLVTLQGMVIESRLLQPEKAPSSIIVVEFEIAIDLKLLQPLDVEKSYKEKILSSFGGMLHGSRSR